MLIQGSWIICEFITNETLVTLWEMEERSKKFLEKADFEFFFSGRQRHNEESHTHCLSEHRAAPD